MAEFSREHKLLLAKVDGFTDTEFVGLEAWFIAAEVNLYGGFGDEPEGLSARVLRSSLDLEHYQSVLDADPEKWTDEQRVSLADFVEPFERDLAEFKSSPKIQARLAVRERGGRIFAALDRVLRRLKPPSRA